MFVTNAASTEGETAPVCGILAWVGGAIVDDVADAALDLLEHRGPDDRGSWRDNDVWLGNRRLAILDPTPAGHQPMVHAPTGNVLTFNGEIYNYVELRDDLAARGHTFGSGSDTEVVLAAYAQWGAECVRRFNGMWGLALWDARARRLFFSRDRFGVKPLYYALRKGGLALASEPKALLGLGIEPKVDETSLYRFLVRGELYTGERSFYDGIRLVPPGHSGTYEPGDDEPSLTRYWQNDEMLETDWSADDFSELLEDAVRLRLRSDVPVGVTLSGGLDSSAIVHAAARLAGDAVVAFNAESSESHWAARAAAPTATRVHTVSVDERDWLPTLSRIAWHMDGPGYSPAVFPLWNIMRTARDDRVPVLLEGQGADELLGGYAQHVAFAIDDDLRQRRVGEAVRAARHARGTFSTPMLAGWIARAAFPSLTPIHRRRFGLGGVVRADFARRAEVAADGNAPRTFQERLDRDFERDVLPGLLHYGDAISMAHSIEARQPFLDYRLVSLCRRLDRRWKVDDGETKVILRRYLSTVGLKDIARRRDKVGFATPVGDWLTAQGGAAARALLAAPDARIREYATADGIERTIARAARGSATSVNHLYRLVSTEIWLRACVSRA